MYRLTDSPFMVAVAAFARSAPMMLLGPFTGLVADRMHRGRVLVFTQALGLATANVGMITNKSTSLSSFGVPYACEPNRMILSGLNCSATWRAYLRIAAIGTWSPRYHRSGFAIGFV